MLADNCVVRANRVSTERTNCSDDAGGGGGGEEPPCVEEEHSAALGGRERRRVGERERERESQVVGARAGSLKLTLSNVHTARSEGLNLQKCVNNMYNSYYKLDTTTVCRTGTTCKTNMSI